MAPARLGKTRTPQQRQQTPLQQSFQTPKPPNTLLQKTTNRQFRRSEFQLQSSWTHLVNESPTLSTNTQRQIFPSAWGPQIERRFKRTKDDVSYQIELTRSRFAVGLIRRHPSTSCGMCAWIEWVCVQIGLTLVCCEGYPTRVGAEEARRHAKPRRKTTTTMADGDVASDHETPSSGLLVRFWTNALCLSRLSSVSNLSL